MRWPTIRTWKDFATIVQNIALAVGVCIGGIWTLYTFGALEQREKATIETQKVQLDTQKQQRELQDRAIVDVKLSLEQAPWSAVKGRHIVEARILFENHGNRHERLRLRDPPLRVHRLTPEPDGKLAHSADTGTQIRAPDKIDRYQLSPKEKSRVAPILVEMPSPGVYLFNVCVNLEDISGLVSQKKDPNINSLVVCDSQYLEVK